MNLDELLSRSMATYSGRRAALQSVINPLRALEEMAEAGPPPNLDSGLAASRIVKTRRMRQTLEEIRSIDGPGVSISYIDSSGTARTTTVSHLIETLDWSVFKISEWPGMEEAILAASVLMT